MFLRRDVLFVGCPVVRAVLLNIQVRQFCHQFLASPVVSLADVKGQYFSAVRAVGVPKPALAFLATAHKSPHLVNEDTPEFPGELRLFQGRKPLSKHRKNNENADLQHRVNISNPTPPHRHLPNQPLVPRVGAPVGVKILELLAAGLAPKILLAIRLQPVLFNFVALAMGATHFDRYFAHNPKLLH